MAMRKRERERQARHDAGRRAYEAHVSIAMAEGAPNRHLLVDWEHLPRASKRSWIDHGPAWVEAQGDRAARAVAEPDS